jgi:hypothetical protein
MDASPTEAVRPRPPLLSQPPAITDDVKVKQETSTQSVAHKNSSAVGQMSRVSATTLSLGGKRRRGEEKERSGGNNRTIVPQDGAIKVAAHDGAIKVAAHIAINKPEASYRPDPMAQSTIPSPPPSSPSLLSKTIGTTTLLATHSETPKSRPRKIAKTTTVATAVVVERERKDGEQKGPRSSPAPMSPTTSKPSPKTKTVVVATRPQARSASNVVAEATATAVAVGADPKRKSKPKPELKAAARKAKWEVRNANARRVEQRQLELDKEKVIEGALESVVRVRHAIRSKMIPLLAAYDQENGDGRVVAEIPTDDRGDDGDSDGDGDTSALFSPALLKEFVPLRDFCMAMWFGESGDISEERNARERTGKQISNKARVIGLETLISHSTVCLSIALRHSTQRPQTRWCMIADAIPVAATGPPHRQRYPECAELVRQLARVAASTQLTAFRVALSRDTEEGSGGGGGSGGGDSARVDYSSNATFFIPLSLYSDIPRKTVPTIKQPRSHSRRNRSKAIAPSPPSSPPPVLLLPSNEDAETNNNCDERSPVLAISDQDVGRGDSRICGDGDGGAFTGKLHQPVLDKKRRKRPNVKSDDEDDDDNDNDRDDGDNADIDEKTIATSVEDDGVVYSYPSNKGETKELSKKAISTVHTARDDDGVRAKADDGGGERAMKRARIHRADEPEGTTVVSGSDVSLISVSSIHPTVVAPPSPPPRIPHLSLQELEEKCKRLALLAQIAQSNAIIAQNNAIIIESNRKAEANGGSGVTDT